MKMWACAKINKDFANIFKLLKNISVQGIYIKMTK